MNSSLRFCIQAGVKQGDVLTPALFNAGLDDFQQWKSRLSHHGIDVGFDEGRRVTCELSWVSLVTPPVPGPCDFSEMPRVTSEFCWHVRFFNTSL